MKNKKINWGINMLGNIFINKIPNRRLRLA